MTPAFAILAAELSRAVGSVSCSPEHARDVVKALKQLEIEWEAMQRRLCELEGKLKKP